MTEIFFIYGLAFFCLGLVVALYPKKHSGFWLAKNVWLIAAFSILHGLNEWVDMFIMMREPSDAFVLQIVRTFLLPLSFLFLLQFGTKGIIDLKNIYRGLRIAPVICLILWAIIVTGSKKHFIMADIWARYLLAAPGIFLTSYTLILQKNVIVRADLATPRYYLKLATAGFFLYGLFAGVIVPEADFFPAAVFNYSLFYDATGIPVQVFRALCAVIIAYSMVKVLEIFDLETKESLIKNRNELEFMVKDRTRALIESNAKLEQEIVEHKRAEDLLRHERDNVQKYLNLAGVVMVAIDSDQKVNLINKKGCEILEYSEQEIIGENWFDLFIPDGDRNEARTLFTKVMSGGIEPFESFENVVLTKSGRQRIIAWHNVLLRDGANSIIGSLSSGEDITERNYAEEAQRESEQKYRDLFENANDAIFIVDADLNYTDVNKRAVELFGFSKEEILGMNILNVIPPGQKPRSQKELEKLKDKKSYDKFVGKMKVKDGRWLDVEVSSSPIIRGEKVVGSRDIVRDITERKKLEEELIKREKLESLGVLAGGLAHDFNNLLTGILGNISLAKMHADPTGKIFARLTEAEKASLRARDLTQQLLTFSRGGAPIKETVNIGELIRETAAFSLSGSEVRCIYEISDDLLPVEVDAGQMSQVINNLVINANQAMPEGGTITIACQNVSLETENRFSLAQGNYIKITIKDQGSGIREEHFNKIFDPYFTTKQKGSGLGLASAYSIVRKHNGHITVESTLGSGTSFHIYLPASEKEILPGKIKRESFLTGKGKILIVDDEEIVREVTGEMLRTMGYDVEFANDGEVAVRLYKEAQHAKAPFHVVIMDLTIPGGTGGKEAMAKLLETDPNVKAIVSSGYSQDPVMAHFRDYGFSGVVSKPYKLLELGKTLHHVLNAGPE